MTYRPPAIPYGWLYAEAASWPLASESSFNHQLKRIEHTQGILRGAAELVATDLIEALRPAARGLSVESLRQVATHAWFDGAGPSGSIVRYLTRLAEQHLVTSGDVIILREDGDRARTAARWRWLSFALPTDTLAAALAAARNVSKPAEGIDVMPRMLASRILGTDIAETHLHVGAAVSFAQLWSSIVATAGTLMPKTLKNEGRSPFGSRSRFVQRLLEAAIARLLLARFLRANQLGWAGSFDSHVRTTLQEVGNTTSWPAGSLDVAFRLDAVRHALVRAAVSMPLPEMRLLYRRITAVRAASKRTEPLDPMSSWLVRSESPDGAELLFQTRSIRYLLDHHDPEFSDLFWQYLRVRNVTYRHVVQSPGTAGLDWFARHYSRLSPLRRGLERSIYSSAIKLQSAGMTLGSIEMRTSPANSWVELRREAKTIARQAASVPLRRGKRPEVGLILHFIKEGTRRDGRTTMLHANPRSPAHGCRYGAWHYAKWREANSIARVLRYCPELLLVIRGIDVASRELTVPTWPLLPLFEFVRRASQSAAEVLRRARADWNVPPVRATAHAGEDYRTLTEGLRRVHELIEFGAIGAGDRIGHAIALADDPERWAMRVERSIQPKDERLDDLLWQIERYDRRELLDLDGRRSALSFEARQLAALIHGHDVAVEELLEARRLRHSPDVLERLGYPFMQSGITSRLSSSSSSHKAVDLLLEHLTDPGVFDRGLQPIEVTTTDDDVRFLSAAQRWMRRTIARLEITVESNPSSNLLIGDMVSLDSHPALQLQPLKNDGGADRVLLSINTDDPVTFATRLSDEYAYIYFALLRGGIDSDTAFRWISDRIRDGWTSRFTVPHSADATVLSEIGNKLSLRGEEIGITT